MLPAFVKDTFKSSSFQKLVPAKWLLPILQAIFASETIQDIIPLASNAILILGQVEGIQGSKVYFTELVAFDYLIPLVLFVIISHVMSCSCLQGHRALVEVKFSSLE
ncbi:hypothetical protein CsSME_00020747 [Camellia sinensis var. sinensis]